MDTKIHRMALTRHGFCVILDPMKGVQRKRGKPGRLPKNESGPTMRPKITEDAARKLAEMANTSLRDAGAEASIIIEAEYRRRTKQETEQKELTTNERTST